MVVDQWSAHMRSKGVKRVLCLLHEPELGFYADDLLATLRRHFGGSGCGQGDVVDAAVAHVVPHAEGALAGVVGCLDRAFEAREPVVVFCSTGQARTGMVLAYWLHYKYHLAVASAVSEVSEFASLKGATRKPSVEHVLHFAVGPAASAKLPALHGSTMQGQAGTHGAVTFGTPRVDHRLHITFLQMGGAMDKDYPRVLGGYGFEMGDPAVHRVLAHAVPIGFTHDVLSVARKDGADLTLEDKQSLVETIRRSQGCTKFVVTHGVEKMIETASFVAQAKGIVNKTVVFTGATRPQKMVDSDAAFNVGCAVGALGVLGTGVFLAMHGRVFEATAVRRDGRTGLFVAV